MFPPEITKNWSKVRQKLQFKRVARIVHAPPFVRDMGCNCVLIDRLMQVLPNEMRICDGYMMHDVKDFLDQKNEDPYKFWLSSISQRYY